uniref:Uncharacterized protein n=1 Tax=Anguilla anguilla TaxID=7936 RepID=A0A0E9WBS9_ANGAN
MFTHVCKYNYPLYLFCFVSFVCFFKNLYCDICLNEVQVFNDCMTTTVTDVYR